MVALVSPFGLLHLSQERVHFLDRQLPVGAHRAMACHGGEQGVALLCQQAACPDLGEVVQYAARQRFEVAARERGRHGAQRQRARPRRCDLETEQLELLAFGLSLQLSDLSLVQARARAETLTLVSVELDPREALEIALEDMHESLRHEFSTDDTQPLSLEAAMAYIRPHTPPA